MILDLYAWVSKNTKPRGKKKFQEFRAQYKRRKFRKSYGITDHNITVMLVIKELFPSSDSSPAAPQFTLSSLCEAYINTISKRSKRYHSNMRRSFAQFIEFKNKNVDIKQITRADQRRFVDWCERKGIAGITINNYCRMLRAAFVYAEDAKTIKIEDNPFRKFKKSRENRHNNVSYTPEDYRTIRRKAVETYGQYYAMMIDAYLLFGSRDEEMTQMGWEHVDWKLHSETLTVPAEFSKIGVDRIIPLPKIIVQHFKALKEAGFERPFYFSSSHISHLWTRLRAGGKYHGKQFEGTHIAGELYDLRKTAETELKSYPINLNQDFIDILHNHKRPSISKDSYTNYNRALDTTVRPALEKLAEIFLPRNEEGDNAGEEE